LYKAQKPAEFFLNVPVPFVYVSYDLEYVPFKTSLVEPDTTNVVIYDVHV
jgi:hypothetical protein